MKILCLSGSKNPEGRTARAIEAIRKGAEKAGAETECIFLTDKKLEQCRQCDADGWGTCRREGYCVIKDDFESLVEKIGGSDVVVFATPVYFRDLTESMKVFLDRLRRISAFRPEPAAKGVLAAGVSMAGGGGGGATQACLNLESTLQMCQFDVVDMIPTRRQNFEAKLPMLEMTGEWLATRPVSTAQ